MLFRHRRVSQRCEPICRGEALRGATRRGWNYMTVTSAGRPWHDRYSGTPSRCTVVSGVPIRMLLRGPVGNQQRNQVAKRAGLASYA